MMAERRAQLQRARRAARARRSAPPARTRGAAGRTSASSTRRTTAGTTSSSATSSGATTPSGCTSTSGSAAPTARSRSATRCATSCPSCSRSRRARRSSRTWTRGLHSARTQIFTRMFPRCGIPDAYDGWQDFEDYVRFLYETGSITEHTQIWWSVRPHLAFPTVEIRICDAQPDLAEAQALAALIYSLAARMRARARRGRAAAEPAAPAARGEPLARDPLRALGRADRLRPRRAGPGAGAARAADRVGAAGRRGARRGAVPRGPERERGRAPDRAARGGASLEEIYAEQVRRR